MAKENGNTKKDKKPAAKAVPGGRKAHKGWRERAARLKTDIPALYLCLKRRDTPLLAKLLAVLTVGYALSPIDLIPDWIPFLGLLDDILILPALVALTVGLLPQDTLADCRKHAEALWKNGRPKQWYFALPVVLFWLLVLWLILKHFL